MANDVWRGRCEHNPLWKEVKILGKDVNWRIRRLKE